MTMRMFLPAGRCVLVLMMLMLVMLMPLVLMGVLVAVLIVRLHATCIP